MTSALVGAELSASCTVHFTSGAHWLGSGVGPRGSLDDIEKSKLLTLPGLELRPHDRPVAIPTTLPRL
jgi:hypothetical protein